ncbi:OmpA-OmpF porin, OOP family [Paucidesulfovibrio gracilis DSM 16080]|uniref:OmpA-OmpF porin, OOP family n=1 Tax=Paucidesulfovibrio gracilis DSM 16080 TaxID=1121449 RepID=A0A1T4X785_9BACT|nr:OmpA family protein [Paucidesulfovibrio gracilis]SKA85493.1 OmpA-OmpF porin, OOP family [Paucidesulfovibrio gracilis DSM 16080]
MRNIRFVTVVLLLTAMVWATGAAAGEIMVRKADNVFFCVDTSGSMMSEYHGDGMSDLAAAKVLLDRMVRAMPDLGYKSALYRFAPFKELRGLEPQELGNITQAVADLPSTVPMFGNRTPLGQGLYDLAWPIAEVPGPTAVILFTDGGQNEGEHPLPVAEQLFANYDVCLHVVSFANSEREQTTINELAGLSDCSVMARASDLLADQAALDAFVRDTLWTMKPEPAPPAPPVSKREFHTVRMDLYLEFDTNSAEIRQEFHDEVAKLGELLQRYPESTAMIVGYTDDVGSYTSNIRLSTRRAQAVKKHLMQQFNVAPGRLEAVGYGENFPAQESTTAEARQRNRRVTVFVTGWFVEVK